MLVKVKFLKNGAAYGYSYVKGGEGAVKSGKQLTAAIDAGVCKKA